MKLLWVLSNANGSQKYKMAASKHTQLVNKIATLFPSVIPMHVFYHGCFDVDDSKPNQKSLFQNGGWKLKINNNKCRPIFHLLDGMATKFKQLYKLSHSCSWGLVLQRWYIVYCPSQYDVRNPRCSLLNGNMFCTFLACRPASKITTHSLLMWKKKWWSPTNLPSSCRGLIDTSSNLFVQNE